MALESRNDPVPEKAFADDGTTPPLTDAVEKDFEGAPNRPVFSNCDH
jgi:hypothetical protein